MNDKYTRLYRPNPTTHILGHFLDYPDQGFYGQELSRMLKISSGAVHGALTELYCQGILERERKGKTLLYFLNEQAPVVRSLKIIHSIELLLDLVKKLSLHAREVYLFGSSAAGEYVSGSDIDLAVIVKSASDTEKVEEIVDRHQTKRKIQLIVFTAVDWESLEKKDPMFYAKVTKGLNLYNQPIDELKFREVS